jgi:indole-3-glycerol phosphate synthase
LKTFSTDVGITLSLAPRIPADRLVVAESGLSRREDLALLAKAGVTTFLVGEGLMRQNDLAAATSMLTGAKLFR